MGTRVELCHICRNVATLTCKMCGRPTCAEHMGALLDVCDSCRRGES